MISGIGLALHAEALPPFDAGTNTAAETAASNSFDAISQQSVKQKPFVAVLRSAQKQRYKDVRLHKRMADESSVVEAHSPPRGKWCGFSLKLGKRQMSDEGGSNGTDGALCSVINEGHEHTYKGV